MVAVVSGNSLGLELTSLGVLGRQGLWGTPGQGRGGEQVWVNASNGNLVVQRRDALLAGLGPDAVALRTYNSQGRLDDDNADNWTAGFVARQLRVDTAANTLTRVAADASEALYRWDASRGRWLTTDGDGAHDTIVLDAAAGRYLRTDGSTGAVERYDSASGRLLSVTDADGQTLSFHYNARGLIERIRSGSGESLVHVWDTTNPTRLVALRSETTEGGTTTTRHLVTYEYDARGRLGLVHVDMTPDVATDAVRYSTRYSYLGTTTQVTRIEQSDGSVLDIGYESGRVSSVSDATGAITRFAYDSAAGSTTITDATGRAWTVRRQADGQIREIVPPAGSGGTQRFEYDAQGNVTAVDGGDGRITRMAYDAHGNAVRITDAANNARVFSYEHDAARGVSRLVAETVSTGQPSVEFTTRHVWSGAQLRYTVSAEGRVTRFSYNGLGQRVGELTLTAQRYPVAGLTATQHPTVAQLDAWYAGIADRSGAVLREYAYDARGLLRLRIEYEAVAANGSGVGGRTTSYVHDSAGRLLQTLAPLVGGTTTGESGRAMTTVAYDALGMVVRTVDARGVATTKAYDDPGLGQPASGGTRVVFTNGAGGVTTTVLDRAGRVLTETRGSDPARQFAYDAEGRLLMSTDATGRRQWFILDTAGREVGRVDADGSLIETVRDGAGRVVRTIAYARAVDVARLVDTTGRPLAPALSSLRPAAQASDLHRWSVYDAAGRLVYELADHGADRVSVTAHTYDGAGRLVRTVRHAQSLATASLGAGAPSAATLAALLTDPAVLALAGEDRVTRLFHDADGLLAGTLDAEGYLTRHTYDGAGRLVRTVRHAIPTPAALRAAGTLEQLTPAAHVADQIDDFLYDARGLRVGRVDAEGWLTRSEYTARGQLAREVRYADRLPGRPTAGASLAALVASIRPQGLADPAHVRAGDRSRSFTYALDGQLTRSIAEDGTVTTYGYDSAGRRETTTIGSTTTTVTWDAWDRQARTTTARGHATDYTYDAEGRLIAVQDARGHRTLHFLDADGRVAYTVNALGEVQERRFDALGELTATVSHAERIATGGLDPQGRVDDTLRGRLADIVADSLTRYERDGAGRLVATTFADGTVQRLAYNAFGEETERRSAWKPLDDPRVNLDLRTDLTRYDRRGLVTGTTADAGTGRLALATTLERDAFGRIVRRVGPDGTATRTEWDRLGRAVASFDELGNSRQTTYDAFDRVVETRDELGAITRHAYDWASRTLTTTTPAGVQVTTTRNAQGQTIEVVVRNSGSTTVVRRSAYEYDLDGNLTATRIGGQLVESREHDALGLLSATVDGRGARTEYRYDAARRMLERTVAAGDPNAPRAAGVPVPLNLRTTWAYDAKGQAVRVTDPRGVVTEIEFDAMGRQARSTLDPGGLALVTTWAYDAEGRVVRTTAPGGRVTVTEFDALGRRIAQTLDPDGLAIRQRWDWDADGRVVAAWDALGNATRYRYDATGRLTWTAGPDGAVTRTEYDATGRRIRETRFANTVAANVEPSSVTASPGRDRTSRWAWDADGRLQTSVDPTGAATAYEYDAAGSVTRATAYARLANIDASGAITVTATAGQDRVTVMAYDAAGRLRTRVDPAGTATVHGYDPAGNLEVSTVYSRPAVIDAATGAITVTPTAGQDRITRQTWDAAGRLATVTNALNGVQRFTYDGAGNRETFTNEKNATWTYVYDAAGRMVQEISPAVELHTTTTADVTGDISVSTSGTQAIVTRIAYDAAGNVTARTEAFGRPEARTTTYEYDRAGRQVRVVYPRVGVYAAETDAALAANGQTGTATRSETAGVAPETRTHYDSAGNAVAGIDRAGNASYKTYDAAGRVRFEIDALGHVTGYERDAHGSVIRLTRYATPISLEGLTPATAAAVLSPQWVATRVAATAPDNRVLVHDYDAAGRLVRTTEPQAFQAWMEGTTRRTSTTSAVTETTWNAFGEAVRVSRLARDFVDATGTRVQSWQHTHHYFDSAGRRVATVDEGRFLTAFEHDSVGNLVRQVEYRSALTGSITIAGYTAPAAVDTVQGDRDTRWTYDLLDRKTRETRVGVAWGSASTATGITTTRGDLSTRFDYDAVGNLVRTIDAGGGQSHTWFDALGRVRATAAPARPGAGGANITPVVEFQRDAHGNVLARTERANSATGVSMAGYAVAADNTNDRTTLTRYDLAGNALQIRDAMGFTKHQSFTIDGRLAKSWQTVESHDGQLTTIYAVMRHDALGRVVQTASPAPAGERTASVTRETRYNAFGEVIARGVDGGEFEEYFQYDNAGRLWKTNHAPSAGGSSTAGAATVFLHDLLGRRTAEITSAGPGRPSGANVANATSAAQAAGWASTRRTDYRHDALGHVVEQIDPERRVVQGGITVRAATAGATVVASSGAFYRETGESSGYYEGFGSNEARLTWTDLSYLGSGDVRVTLTYATRHAPDLGWSSSTRSITRILAGHEAAAGTLLQWTDADADTGAGYGLQSVTALRVDKRDVNGQWVTVVDRGPSRPFSTVGTQIEIGSPLDPRTAVSLRYRLAGTVNWTTASGTALRSFGDAHWLDTSAWAAGTYEYEVVFTEPTAAQTVTESGTFTTGTTDTDDSSKSNPWRRPTVLFERDRWGNMLSQTDPRNRSWKSVYTYDHADRMVREQRPDAVNGALGTASPVRTFAYDRLGRQFAVQDANGWVTGSRHDAGGNLVEQLNPDGGRITHAYDAFGQRVRTVSAEGNADPADALRRGQNTTLHRYDRLGRLEQTQRGDVDGGAVHVWSFDGTMLTPTTSRANLVDRFAYDALGRLVRQTNAAGETTLYRHDRAGNLVETRQPLGQLTRARFDAQGRKIAETDANGAMATWTYSHFGQLTARTDIGGAAYTLSYDPGSLQLVSQTSTRGQNLAYTYDAVGQLLIIRDSALAPDGKPIDKFSTFAYDLAGRTVREKVTQRIQNRPDVLHQVLQDNHLGHDVLGRLVESADNRARLRFSYDLAGNRTRIQSFVMVATVADRDVEDTFAADRWFTFDAMNRQTAVDAIDATGAISAKQGHQLTYDLDGNRTSDRSWGNKVVSSQVFGSTYNFGSDTVEYTAPVTVLRAQKDFVTETYAYDAADRLQIVRRDGYVIDQRRYDGAGRLVQSAPVALPAGYAEALNDGVAPSEQLGLRMRRFAYDANGRLLQQATRSADGGTLLQRLDYRDYSVPIFIDGGGGNQRPIGSELLRGYDAAGNALHWRLFNHEGQSYTNSTFAAVARLDGYVQREQYTESTLFRPGRVTYTHDANGHLVAVDDANQNSLDKTLFNDAAGRVLRVDQAGQRLWNVMVQGQMLGQHGVGPDVARPRSDDGGANMAQRADFASGYRAISGSHPGPSSGAVTVQPGDTLRSIALAAWGDAGQWWRIAQANGLASERDVRVGQTLVLPSIVSGTSHSAETVRPYDPTEVVGDTSPFLPMPALDDGCGGMGQVLMLVVAIAATALTAGVMAGGAATLGQTMALGAKAMVSVGTLSLPQIAAAAAVGSVASQAVGLATGNLEKFSWKQVALSAVGAAVTAGLPVAQGATTAELVASTMLRTATANVITQGIGVVTGLQESFSWKGVAAAAVGGAVGGAVRAEIGPVIAAQLGEGFASKLLTGVLAGMAAGVAVGALRGGRFSMQQVAVDAFGNALGESIVAQMQPQVDSPYSLAGKGAKFGSGGSGVRLGTGDAGNGSDFPSASVRFPSGEEWGGTLQSSLDELRLMSVGADFRDGPLTDAQRAMLAAGRGPLTAGAAAAASMQDDVPTAMAGNTDEPSAQRVVITGQRAPWYERVAYRLQNMFDPESNVHVNLARDTTLIGLPSRLMGGIDAILRGPVAYDDDGQPVFWNERMQSPQRQEEIGLEAASIAMVPTPGLRGLAVTRSGLAFGERPAAMGPNDGPQYVSRTPIDYDHVLGADYTPKGKPTGGHSLVKNDVQIVPGTESVPDAFGVYKATVQVPDPANPGQWLTKTSNNSTNTMFPKEWATQTRIKVEVDSAWNNPNKVVIGDKWYSVTPSGVKVEGWIAPRTTVYPVYQTPLTHP